MRIMIRVGLTGGIGTGKTTVARLFEKKGIPVYYSDNRAKELMQKDQEIKQKLIQAFGEEVFSCNKLNRKYLADIVFSNKNKLKELENIVHPEVRKDFIKWSKQQKAPYVIVENAILHKTGMDQVVDYIIAVTGDQKTRMERVMKRDQVSKKEIENRMNNQENSDFIIKNSDFIIKNDKTLDYLAKKVDLLDQKLKNLLKKS